MYFDILLAVVFFAIFGSLARDGLWSNVLTLFNAVIAGVLATNYFEPLAGFLTGMLPSMVYLWDVLALGLLFSTFYILLRSFSAQLSKYRVQVQGSLDRIAGIALAAWVGWVGVCFVCFAILRLASRWSASESVNAIRRRPSW